MGPEVPSCMPYEGVVLFIISLRTRIWWFRACEAEQHEAFWAAHSRSAKFSPGAMSLMTRIFNVKPQERITLAEILKLILCLMRMEREEKNRAVAKQQLQQHDEEFNPFKIDVDRSVAIPSSTAVTAAPASSKKASTYPSTRVALYTSFQSSRTATELQKRVVKALKEHSVRDVEHKDRFKIKATMTAADKEDLGFAVRIYSLDNVRNPCKNAAQALRWRCVVEFRRTSGESLKFQEAYKKLSKLLCDLISQLAKGRKQESGWYFSCFECHNFKLLRDEDEFGFLENADTTHMLMMLMTLSTSPDK
ncbi:hypothetical protein PsorP6_000140 [Peronosclerospora sorghi]|uniref:Uncharacterized protein n=1 Tax=Peronosclerospora sorghi TaxID=230839 RepID=A0ACC0WY48_9STRA|nr:hypothetical protein PsorP6_000140 [Peronosclerospora sorghi]